MRKLGLAVVVGCTMYGISPELAAASDKVGPCELFIAEDSSAGQQKRMRIFVYSDAQSESDQIATAKAAALTAIKDTGYDYVDVALLLQDAPRSRSDLSSSSAVAWVGYAPRPSRIPFMDDQWRFDINRIEPALPNFYVKDRELSDEEVAKVDTSNGSCELSGLRRQLDR